MRTLDIEPTWVAICRGVQRGIWNAKELEPACEIADAVRQAQKSGARSITFTFGDNGEIGTVIDLRDKKKAKVNNG